VGGEVVCAHDSTDYQDELSSLKTTPADRIRIMREKTGVLKSARESERREIAEKKTTEAIMRSDPVQLSAAISSKMARDSQREQARRQVLDTLEQQACVDLSVFIRCFLGNNVFDGGRNQHGRRQPLPRRKRTPHLTSSGSGTARTGAWLSELCSAVSHDY
jgi:hypothetical protein